MIRKVIRLIMWGSFHGIEFYVMFMYKNHNLYGSQIEKALITEKLIAAFKQLLFCCF